MAAVSVKLTDVPAHIVLPGLAAIEAVGDVVGFTVMARVLLVAVAGIAQPRLLVSAQVTISLLASVAVLYVGLLLPTFILFTFHWYDGVLPPLAGVAVKSTEAPAQIVVPLPDAIVTEAGAVVPTLRVATFELTVSDMLNTLQRY